MSWKPNISKWHKRITGIAFLVIYLMGLGFSIYSSLPASLIAHKHTYCTVSFCGCVHEASECNCDHTVQDNEPGELTYIKCKTPVSDSYTGISISPFLTENSSSFQTYLYSKYISDQFTQMTTQTRGGSLFHPPQPQG